MTSEVDNRIVAAQLAAALITALPTEGAPAAHAVKVFHEVLAELKKSAGEG